MKVLKSKKNAHLTQLLAELDQLKMEAQQDVASSTALSVPADNEVLQQIVHSVNDIVDIYQNKYEALAAKHEIVTELNDIGTWDGEIRQNQLSGDSPNTYNTIFRTALGYENEEDFPEELNSWYNTVSKQDLGRVSAAYDELLYNDVPYDIEYRSVNKDNSVEWVHVRAKALRDQSGNLYRHIGTLRNIHESKLNSLKVQQLLSKLELIEQALGSSSNTDTVEGVWGAQLKGDSSNEDKFWFSPQFKHLLGYKENEYCEAALDTWMDMIVPEEKDIISKQLTKNLDNPEKNNVILDFRLKTKTNEVKWFSMMVKISRDAFGQPTSISGVLRDIDHDIKRLEDNENINKNMRAFNVILNDLADNIKAISQEAIDLAKESDLTLTSSQTAKQNIESTKSVTQLIKTISDQTNLLGINASIEASLAGEHGKGFKVVAGEIQKLSTSTSAAVEKIEQILENVNQSVLEIADSIDTMSHKIQHQAEVTQEVKQATESINQNSTELVELIQQLN